MIDVQRTGGAKILWLMLIVISSLPLNALSGQSPSKPRILPKGFVDPATWNSLRESPEHAFAQNQLAAVKHQFEDSQAEYKGWLVADSQCKATEDGYMVDCWPQTKQAWRKMEELSQQSAKAEVQLRDVDKCLVVYRNTIDKRISDQTTREVELIKACQSEDLYPPRNR